MTVIGVTLAGTPYQLGDAVIEQVALKLNQLELQATTLRHSGVLTEDTLRHYYGQKRFEHVAESNALEGSTLSVGETELAVLRGVTITGHAPQFIRDAIALDAALNRITDLARQKEPTTDILQLQEIHTLLLGDHPAAGSFRRERVTIRGSAHTPPKTWQAVMQQMEQWEQWSAHAAKIPAPLRSAVLHAWLTHVHPWLDGNGRTARAVGNLELIRAGFPPIIIKRSERTRYLDALAQSDQAGDIRLFLELILDKVELALLGLERSVKATQNLDPAAQQVWKLHEHELAILDTALQLLADSLAYHISAALQSVGGECRVTKYPEPLSLDDYAELCAGRSVPKPWAFRLRISVPGRPPLEKLAWFGCRSPAMVQHLSLSHGPALYWSSGNTLAFPPWLADADHSPFAVELTTATGHGDQWFARLPDHSIRAFSTSDLVRGIAESLLSAAKQN
ncbi:MAG UNVERIFIED_CONTAM: Fic family protein [Planctomycetaceae bacterium]|jgi:Fic family protein